MNENLGVGLFVGIVLTFLLMVYVGVGQIADARHQGMVDVLEALKPCKSGELQEFKFTKEFLKDKPATYRFACIYGKWQ